MEKTIQVGNNKEIRLHGEGYYIEKILHRETPHGKGTHTERRLHGDETTW